MDPIATILAILSTTDEEERIDLTDMLRNWYAGGGFRPTLEEVVREQIRRGDRRSRLRKIVPLL